VPETLIHHLAQAPGLLDIATELPGRYPYLLESATSGSLGSHSLLLRAAGETLCLSPDGTVAGPGSGTGFLGRFDDWYRSESVGACTVPGVPFIGGWFVFLGYELAAEIEPVLNLPPAPDSLPVAIAARCNGAIIVNHGDRGGATLVAESGQVLREIQADLETVRPAPDGPLPRIASVVADPEEDFVAAVGRIQEYLRAGDVFQVNISRGWRGRIEHGASRAYRSLRESNPAPFAGMMQWQGQVLLSSSPERLVELRGDLVQTRPIAGTYPRGNDAASDLELSQDLLAHPKERAEHVMLIDLERNDLGRVCRAGSVEVSELMVVESYAHVHHIVSNVRGRLRAGMTPVDVMRAVFPGGTITGCPKVRCMQIIAELEGQGRGYYTGSMGYVGRDGSMDLNILIRSMLLNGREFGFRTGAGIVADSEAGREVAETVVKARGLIDSLGSTDD
jgi:anthranilate synthase component 1